MAAILKHARIKLLNYTLDECLIELPLLGRSITNPSNFMSIIQDFKVPLEVHRDLRELNAKPLPSRARERTPL